MTAWAGEDLNLGRLFLIRVSSRVLRYCSCAYDLRFPETCPVNCTQRYPPRPVCSRATVWLALRSCPEPVDHDAPAHAPRAGRVRAEVTGRAEGPNPVPSSAGDRRAANRRRWFHFRPCASRRRDATDQVADSRDL